MSATHPRHSRSDHDDRYDAQFDRRIQQRRDLPYGDPQRLDDVDEPLVGTCHDCWQMVEDCLCERSEA